MGEITLGQFYGKVFRPYTFSLTLLVLCALLLGWHGLLNAYLIKVLINRMADGRYLAMPVVLMIVNFLMNSILWRAVGLINFLKIPLIKNEVLRRATSAVHRQPYAFFQDVQSGSISSQIAILAEGVERGVGILLVRCIRASSQFLAALLLVAWVHPLFSLALLLWATLFVGSTLFFSDHVRSLSKASAKSQSQTFGHIVDTITNFPSIKLFSAEKREEVLLERPLQEMQAAAKRKGHFFLKFYSLQGLSISLLQASVLALLIVLKERGLVTLGDFAFILSTSVLVIDNIWMVTDQIDELNEVAGRCREALSLLFPSNQEHRGKGELSATKGAIAFDRISFGYPGKAPLFQNFSLSIHPGERVGLVGSSGGGKSTLISLLLRLHESKRGTILIDGQDITTVSSQSLRSRIGVVPQDPSLFHRTLLENIRCGRPSATDDEVIEIARRVGIDPFISQLKEGYETVVGERGLKLSGGERQRIAIARAMLKQPNILVLDEATSQLDSLNEDRIVQLINRLMKGKTTLVIAHRLATVVEMDRLLFLREGELVEEGSHQELLKLGGEYAAFWKAQGGKGQTFVRNPWVGGITPSSIFP